MVDPGTSCEAWSARYEQLRANWFDQQTGWGQTLFIRQGMAAWIRAWSAATPPGSMVSGECVASQSTSQSAAIHGELQHQLTRELANLILHRQQEVLA
jgi:hypothetical protein